VTAWPTAPVGTGLDALTEADPYAPAVTCGELTLSRAELARRANRLARQLARLGVRHGSLVTIGLPNSAEFYVAVVAVWKARCHPAAGVRPTTRCRADRAARGRRVTGGDRAGPRRRPAVAATRLRTRQTISDQPLPPATPRPGRRPPRAAAPAAEIIIAGGAGTVETITARSDALRIGPDEVFLVTAPLYTTPRSCSR